MSRIPVSTVAAVMAMFCVALTVDVGSVRAEEMKLKRTRSSALGVVEWQVRRAFPDVPHMTTAKLAELMEKDPGAVILLDVRTPDEIAVSALAEAHPASPASRSSREIAGLSDRLDGKIVVAYCAIGLRSARLIVRIGQSLSDRGAVEVVNLEGGLFRWRNEGRPLTGPAGPTRSIHAYNTLWRQFLVEDPD